MHAANICTKNYANGKKLQVKTTWRRAADATYSQQHRASVRSPHVARALPAPTRLRITVISNIQTPTENLSRFCKIFTIFLYKLFSVWNN